MILRRRQSLLLAGLLLLLAGSYLTWRGLRSGPVPAGAASDISAFRDDRPLPPFVLHGPRGAFGNAGLRGRWSFLFLGYTQCPDICPTALSLMKEVKATLAGAGAVPPAPTFQVVFISVDPQRDTPALLGEYLAAFDAEFIGVSGADAALAPLAAGLGAHYQRHDGTGSERYSVDHSAAIYLIDPEGRLRATFAAPQHAPTLAASLRRLAQA